MKNLLSVIINCRNDNYHKNFSSRLSKSLNLNLYFLSKIDQREKIKFVISDWGSEQPLSYETKIYKKYVDNVDFVHTEKSIADKMSSNQPGGFYPELSANIGVRKSNSEYILYTGSDQIFSKSGWLNLINLLENKNKLETSIIDTVFYIPRKFINLDFYRRDPSFYMFERYIDYMNFSALPYKTPSFFVGGGYTTLCSKKIWVNMRGLDEDNIKGCATDVDFNSRIKRMGLNQIDTSHMGIHMYKFPIEPNSVRQKLLYKTKSTRRIPDLKKDIAPNNENWGLAEYKIDIKKSNNLTPDLHEENQSLFLKKSKKSLGFKEKLKILFFFQNYKINVKELKLLFFITCLLKSIRTWSFVECGFDNINRVLSIGKGFKYLEYLIFDQDSLLKGNDYRNRLFKTQILLSNNRHAKFTALNSHSYEEFIKLLKKISNEKFSNFFLLNFEKVEKNTKNLDYLKDYLINNSDLFSIIFVTNPSNDYEQNFKIFEKNFKMIFVNEDLLLFFNKNVQNPENLNDEITDMYKQNSKINYLSIVLFANLISLYKNISRWIKKIHFKLFNFKF